MVFTIDQKECASLPGAPISATPSVAVASSLSSNCTVVMLRIESARNVDQDLTAF